MNDKQEIKLHSDKLYVESEQDGDKTIVNIKAKGSLEDEAFEREFECCRKMKSAKPEPAPHPELLGPPKTLQSRCAKVDIPRYDNEWLRKKIKSSDDKTSLRKERDDLKERCSDLELQIDSLEAQVSKLKLENVALKDTVIALKECESVKKQAKLIMEKYPQAYPATEGVKVGDVLCNHIDVPPVIATKEILERFACHDRYFVIANVGDGYHFISDIQP